MKNNKEQAYAEIMHMFRYNYKNEWAPESIFSGKTRIWIQAFNDLIKQGYIQKKKKQMGHKYKWTSVWPKNY